MNNVLVTVFVCVAILACFAPARADIWFGGDLPYAFSNQDIDNGLGFQGRIQADVKPFLQVEGAVGSYSSDTKVGLVSEGDYGVTWLTGSLILQMKKGEVRPFGGLGFGYFMPSHNLSDRVNQILAGMGIRATEDINSGPGVMVKGGVLIELSRTARLHLTINYFSFNPDVDFTVTEIEGSAMVEFSEKIDLSTYMVGIGVSFNPFTKGDRYPWE